MQNNTHKSEEVVKDQFPNIIKHKIETKYNKIILP